MNRMLNREQKNKLFATTYEDDMVLSYIIPQLQWKQIYTLLKGSPLLRGKCKCFDMSQVKEENEKEIKQNILNCYQRDQRLKEALNICWNMQTEIEAKLIRKYPESEELREHIDCENPKLGIITQLWLTKKEENKILGDELFETYVRVKEDGGNQEMEEINGELLNKSLLEVIKEATVTKQKMATLESRLEEKDAQIAELKKQAECLSFTKDLKRQVLKMSEKIQKIEEIVTKQQTEQTTKLTQIDQQIQDLEKLLIRENKDMNKKQQDAFKNAIDQMNNQIAKQVTKGINVELKNIFDSIQEIKQVKIIKEGEYIQELNQIEGKNEEIIMERNKEMKEVSSIEEELLNELKMFGI